MCVDGTARRQRDVYLRVVIDNYVVMVVMQVFERVWPLSRAWLEDGPDFDLQRAESRRDVLFSSPVGLSKMCDVWVSVKFYRRHGILRYVYLPRSCAMSRLTRAGAAWLACIRKILPQRTCT